MKKTLLTLAAVAMTAGAWAQEGLENIAPSGYDFNQINSTVLDEILRADLRQPVAFNLNNPAHDFIHGNLEDGTPRFPEKVLEQGSVLFGAFVFNQTKEEVFKQAFNLYNLGGTLGQVLILNGPAVREDPEDPTSPVVGGINNAIKDALELDELPGIPYYTGGQFGANFQYNHIMNYFPLNELVKKANPDLNLTDEQLFTQPQDLEITPIRLRARVELNIFNNDMDAEWDGLGSIFIQNELGTTFGPETSADGGYVDVTQFSNKGVWDPTKWLVREWDFDYKGSPIYLKFLGEGAKSGMNNGGAILVRSIQLYVVSEEETYPNITDKDYSAYNDSFNTYTISAVEQPSDEPETLYVIGNSVDGESWTAMTNEMTFADGVYTWSGDLLGSGFKINNGSWADDNYNIGAPENAGALELDKAYNVVAAANSGNIVFADFISVENATVVYDPEKMTVTVTGDPVYPEPETPEALYIIGNIKDLDWNPANGIAGVETEKGSGIFTFTGIELVNETAYFTFVNIKTDDWGTINDGTHRYGPAAGQNAALTVGDKEVKFQLAGDASFNIAGGLYDFTVDFNTWTFSVVANTSGVSSINTENAPVEYYNLQGVKVANPQNGVYIIRQGNTTKKAVIR